MVRHSRVRRGAVAVWTLLALPVAVLLLALALSSSGASLLAEQSRRTADASAQAAAEALVGDALLRARLTGHGAYLRPTFDASHAEAVRAAGLNPIYRDVIAPERNGDNDPDGEFVVGSVPQFGFQAPFTPAAHRNWADVNAVRIHLERTGRDAPRTPGGIPHKLAVTSAAMLDGDVAGFQPGRAGQAIPMAPFALDERAWNLAIETAEWEDEGLPEIEVRLMARRDPHPGRNRRPTAVAVTLGTRSPDEFLSQILTGVTEDQYERFTAAVRGPLELDEESGRLPMPGDRHYGHSSHSRLLAGLGELRKSGEPRVFPVTRGFAGDGRRVVWVNGFVAARVVHIKEEVLKFPEHGLFAGLMQARTIVVTLRPAMVCSPTVVTRPTAPPNPYVCTVRLVIAR
ncbi:MAG TPA: hypothetical protein VKD90_18885 [Gemmataceae bacterium]|nr:hypothetical protein [Gemmataceae bacterium]